MCGALEDDTRSSYGQMGAADMDVCCDLLVGNEQDSRCYSYSGERLLLRVCDTSVEDHVEIDVVIAGKVQENFCLTLRISIEFANVFEENEIEIDQEWNLTRTRARRIPKKISLVQPRCFVWIRRLVTIRIWRRETLPKNMPKRRT